MIELNKSNKSKVEAYRFQGKGGEKNPNKDFLERSLASFLSPKSQYLEWTN